MSFSGTVKEELAKYSDAPRHCLTAELSAVLAMCGRVLYSLSGGMILYVKTENLLVAQRAEYLIRTLTHVRCEVKMRMRGLKGTGSLYTAAVTDTKNSEKILRLVSLMEERTDEIRTERLADPALIRRECCRRSFLRGAFLCCGSVSDPRKFYHLEFTCPTQEWAGQLQEMIRLQELEPKIVLRKQHYVVYLKEGAQIVDMLGYMGAVKALMEMENIRILREISNKVNRKVNCETANINKTVNAAVRQLEDIRLIHERIGFSGLPRPLQQMAQVRMEEPDMALKDLGALLDPPIGKSGVNHRLKKLSDIAQKLREERE